MWQTNGARRSTPSEVWLGLVGPLSSQVRLGFAITGSGGAKMVSRSWSGRVWCWVRVLHARMNPGRLRLYWFNQINLFTTESNLGSIYSIPYSSLYNVLTVLLSRLSRYCGHHKCTNIMYTSKSNRSRLTHKIAGSLTSTNKFKYWLCFHTKWRSSNNHE